MIAPLGTARQRYGWTYRGSDAVAAYPMAGVARTSFALTSNDITVVSGISSGTNKGYVYRQDSPSGGTAIWTNPRGTSTTWIPRCVYNGDLIFCAQDGESPLLRYAGATVNTTTTTATTVSVLSGSMEFTTAASFSASRGSFFTIRPTTTSALSKQPSLSSRVIETDSDKAFTVESLRNGSAASVSSGSTTVTLSPFGFTWPAVPIYEVGTMSGVSGTTTTLVGTRMTSVGVNTTSLQNDALLVDGVNGGPLEIADITSVTDDTTVVVSAAITGTPSNQRIRVLRRSPFKDATVHKGSLWGTGVKQYPNRVYVFPATKDIGLPPAAPAPAEIPYDAISRAGYANATVTGYTTVGDYTAFSDGLDIPSRYDRTPVVALLSTSNPLLVLKTDAVYGIYGLFVSRASAATNTLEVTKISDGSGCIDLRSAVSYESVPYWAGPDGIYTWRDNAIVDLTAGKIRQEWQALMSGYQSGSCVTTGVVSGSYLVVSATGLDSTRTGGAKLGPDSSNPTDRTLVYDLRSNVWLGRVSNFKPTHLWSTTVEDGGESLLAVDGATHQGRIINFLPAVAGGDPADADGTYPRFKAWTSSSLAQAEGIEGDARLCDLMVHINLVDASTPTSTLDLSVVSGGSLTEPQTQTKTLTPITADTTNRVDRFKRQVNRTGRLHQVRVDMSVTDSSNYDSQIPEMVFSFRDSRRGT